MLYEDDDVLLVTGVPGWLGNRMLEIFTNGDYFGNNAISRKIRLLVEPKFKNVISFTPAFEVFYGDITNRESLKEPLRNVKTVYHLAGVVYPRNIKAYYSVNVQGTKNLVDVCIEQGVKRFLFMSSDSICGYSRSKKIFSENEISKPYKDYGESKFIAEKYLLDKTALGLIEGTSLRGFWFFGPGMPQRNIRFLKMFSWKRQIVFGNGKNLRSISHIDNIVQAFIKAEKNKTTIGKWYWIGDKQAGYTVDEIYSNIASALGKTYRPLYVSPWICDLINACDTLISFFGKINSFIHAAGKFHKNIAGDISAAQRDFNYMPDVAFEHIRQEVKEIMAKEYQKNITAAATF